MSPGAPAENDIPARRHITGRETGYGIMDLRSLKLEFSAYGGQVWLLAAGNMINWMGLTVTSPFLSIYLYQVRGISMGYIGLAMAASAVVGGLGLLASGYLYDRFGRKNVMILGVLAEVLCFIALALAVFLNLGFSVILVLWAASGLAMGVYRTAPQVMIADTVPPDRQNGAYSLLRMGGNLGFAVGPIVGGFIALLSYTLMFMATAAFGLAYLALIVFLLHDTGPKVRREIKKRETPVALLNDRAFLVFCAVYVLFGVISTQLLTTYSVYAGSYDRLSESSIGVLFSLNALTGILLQYPVSGFFNRFRLTTTLAAGFALYGAGYTLVGYSASFWQMALTMVVITFGEIIISPPLMTLVAQIAPPEARGRYIGVSNFIGSAGYALGPVVGGMLMDGYASDIKTMWLLIGGIALAGTAGAILLRASVKEKVYLPAS